MSWPSAGPGWLGARHTCPTGWAEPLGVGSGRFGSLGSELCSYVLRVPGLGEGDSSGGWEAPPKFLGAGEPRLAVLRGPFLAGGRGAGGRRGQWGPGPHRRPLDGRPHVTRARGWAVSLPGVRPTARAGGRVTATGRWQLCRNRGGSGQNLSPGPRASAAPSCIPGRVRARARARAPGRCGVTQLGEDILLPTGLATTFT